MLRHMRVVVSAQQQHAEHDPGEDHAERDQKCWVAELRAGLGTAALDHLPRLRGLARALLAEIRKGHFTLVCITATSRASRHCAGARQPSEIPEVRVARTVQVLGACATTPSPRTTTEP